jgi:hypothetical protein
MATQEFVVLRCKGRGRDGSLIPGTYVGKGGRPNQPFQKAVLLSVPDTVTHWLETLGQENFEPVTVKLEEPD